MEKKKERLYQIIKEKALIKGKFKLSSGGETNIYFDCKMVTQDPEGANLIADIILDLLKDEEAEFIGGLESGSIPISAVVSAKSLAHESPISAFFVRKRQKNHGKEQIIEGPIRRNSKVVLVDDVTTKGNSILRAYEAVKELNCEVIKAVTIIDREEGAKDLLAGKGIHLTPIFKKSDFL
ncbi:MAG: orotate phosphoribosyltransferase [Candidatus Hydrothermarchaeota archaeon]